jgi:hypothetical protein
MLFFIQERREILEGGWIHEPREAIESSSRQFPCVCSFVILRAFYDCNHYCY